jgi:endonuclease G, mitochondrial
MAAKRASAQQKSSSSPGDQEELADRLKQFIRTRGSGLLSDPNISSVGVG